MDSYKTDERNMQYESIIFFPYSYLDGLFLFLINLMASYKKYVQYHGIVLLIGQNYFFSVSDNIFLWIFNILVLIFLT